MGFYSTTLTPKPASRKTPSCSGKSAARKNFLSDRKFAYKIDRNSLKTNREESICTYKTASGRSSWPSREPIEEKGDVNLYAFVINNPFNKWDALGLAVLPERVLVDTVRKLMSSSSAFKPVRSYMTYANCSSVNYDFPDAGSGNDYDGNLNSSNKCGCVCDAYQVLEYNKFTTNKYRLTLRYAINGDVYNNYLARLQQIHNSINGANLDIAQGAFNSATFYTTLAGIADIINQSPEPISSALGGFSNSILSEIANQYNSVGNDNIIAVLRGLQATVRALADGKIIPPQMDDTDVRFYSETSSAALIHSQKIGRRLLVDLKFCGHSEAPGSRWNEVEY